MSKKPNSFNQVLAKLKELHTKYPTYGIARHLSTALSDYGDIWGVSNKELLSALEKYEAELDMNIVPDQDIEAILKDTEEIFSPYVDLDGEDEEDNEFD